MVIKKQINQQYNYTFNIAKAGLAAIFVAARCRSKKQIKSNIDEDLRIEINGMRFREIPPKKYVQVFNIPAAFNGSQLKGLAKTVVFLTVLNKGEHIVSLIPRTTAFVEEIKIKELTGLQDVGLEAENIIRDNAYLIKQAAREFAVDPLTNIRYVAAKIKFSQVKMD